MPSITFIEPDGQARTVDAPCGLSVMEAAVTNGVQGIDADCGGACSCATCHGYIDDAWLDRLPAIDSVEADMLAFAYQRADNSRLTCQLTISEEMDGLLIRLPASQG